MKPLRRHRSFTKSYKKYIAGNPKLAAQFEKRLTLFTSGVTGPPINDHGLSGKMHGKRAFSIAGDIRVVYEETSDAILFIDVGTHSQVYK